MLKINLKSGNTLEIQEASFQDAWALTQAIANELTKGLPGLKLDTLDSAEILQKEMDVGKILSLVFQLVASKPVFELLWDCFKPCLYNGEKIEKGIFDNPSARSDFLPCVVEIVKLNVLPFMKGLDFSLLKGNRDPKAKSQK